jgi:hypothetical protein
MTTTPIRATYGPLGRRRSNRRRLTMALTIPPLAAASLGLTAAIAAGTIQGMHAPAAPAPSPAPATLTLAAAHTRPAYNPFPLLHAKLPVCATEDGSGGPLPCASGPQEGVDFIVIKDGPRRHHVQKVIYIYRDHTERGTI